MVSKASTRIKAIIIVSFIAYGFISGLPVDWHNHVYDMPPWYNLPGYWLGIPFQSMWHWFDTVPWILDTPRLWVVTSVIAWGIIGAALAFLVKPRIIAWISGIYLLVFGGLAAAYYWV